MDAETRRRVRAELAELCRVVDEQSRTTCRPADEPRLMRLIERHLNISHGEPLTGMRWTWCPHQRMIELEPRVGVYLVAHRLELGNATSGVMGRAAVMGATTCMRLPGQDKPAIMVQVLGAAQWWTDSYRDLYGVPAPQVEDKVKPTYKCKACLDRGILHDAVRARDLVCAYCFPGPKWQPNGPDRLFPVTAAARRRGGGK